ncbi:MAG TPA: two-component regulator propeller domain-containing protein [Nitrospira sp.]|nr:two-component regulator propeller domain-containing protein [Nitrospira sp.]
MRKKDGRIVRVLNPSEPSRKVMRVIFCTRDGDLWIGTDAGLYRLSHTGMDFLRVSNNRPSDFGSVFVDHNGLVCLSAGNLNCYEGGKKRDVKLPELKGAQFRAVYRDSSGTLWVGTVGNGVYRLAQGGVATHFLGSTAITGFLKAPDGSMWIGTDDGLAHWSHGEFHIFRGGGMNTVKSMTVGRDGSVWVATPAGLFLLRDGEYIRPEVARKLARYRIWSLFGDKDGSLWIGAGTGLYLWRNGSLRHVDLPRSPSRSQAVISILVDASDRFLIAEPTVVFRLSRNSLEHSIATSGKLAADRVGEVHLSSPPEMFAVGSETGTELYSEIPGVATPDSQGGAWYATYQGLLYIGASPLPPHQISPHVAIERVLVDGAPVALSGPIVLPPSVRNVQIQATPILLSSSLGLQLRGRLLGFDDKWNDLVPGSSSSYGRLPPGQYTFAVQAYWRGMNPVSSAQITFVQQSAFYRRKSFIFACCLVLALLGLLLYRTRIHQMKLRFQAVADERSRVAREIHDTLLQGCIGALSLLEALEISHDQTRGNLKSGQENRWLMILQCVREQFGETIKEAREAIWNLRTADDQKPLSEALHDALERLTSRAGVQTSFCVEGEAIPIRPRVQHEIIMSTREAIMNAVSHASPGVIDVHLRFDSSDITVSICDDGIGFDPKEIRMVKSDHFGLCGMRDRMSKLRGSMIVESKLGLGTKVRLSLPVTACRTRVAP